MLRNHRPYVVVAAVWFGWCLNCLALPPQAPAAGAGAAQPPAPAQVKTQAPGYYRMMLGDFEITALSDGGSAGDIAKLMSNPELAREILAKDHEALLRPTSYNAFLINTGSRFVLVDTGTGSRKPGSTTGRLLANLEAAGYRPEQVDAVLLTHMHGDHDGGLTDDGRRVFDSATVYVNKHELAYWLDPTGENLTAERRERMSEQAHAKMDPYIKAGKVKTFDGATELLPGIRAVPAYGHTPGHTAYMVESQGQRLLLWGDIVHCAEVQFSHPMITIRYDSDPDQAAATREKLMGEAAAQGYLVGGAHISFPGLGHIRAEKEGYAWIPAPYRAVP
ncbi:MAG: MBL fold metallo-hydrolase [Acidobacteria bacterium]|nr:MBL fold metallo-hydrolase [Acidobacteriota bacterium]